MNEIILVIGKVQFSINIDPSVFIFDERRFPLSDRIPGTEGLAMELGPILERAEPSDEVTKVVCHRSSGKPVELTFQQAKEAYLCFAKDGKRIVEGGPALLYLADGSNKEQPIDDLLKLEIT